MACQISEITHSALSNSFIATLKNTGFTIDSRDDVFVKGKGLMHTFNIASIPIAGASDTRPNGRNGRKSVSPKGRSINIGIGAARQRSPNSRGAASARSRWGPGTRLERIQSEESNRCSDNFFWDTSGEGDSCHGVDMRSRR